MLYCRLNILKQDENGNWYKPKNQHRIWRFFRDDLFGWVSWLLPEKKQAEHNPKPDLPEPESESK